MMDFDVTSLYPSAKYDGISVYPKVQNGFAFKLYMNDVCVEGFKNQWFTQNGNESAILKTKI